MKELRAQCRVVAKCLLLALMIVLVVPLQRLVLAVTHGPVSLALPGLFHRLMCRVLGLKLEVRGQPAPRSQVVYIGNHLSYLDVSLLGGRLPACFIAKDDIRAWPVFGALSRLQQTVFIPRDARRAADAALLLHGALVSGHDLILFPEGTTSNGAAVLPFKSSMFAVLLDASMDRVALQPMTLELLSVDGHPIASDAQRDQYAYHGDMHLGPHLLGFMRLSGARLRLHLHDCLPPVTHGMSRKLLATMARDAVAAPLA